MESIASCLVPSGLVLSWLSLQLPSLLPIAPCLLRPHSPFPPKPPIELADSPLKDPLFPAPATTLEGFHSTTEPTLSCAILDPGDCPCS